VAKKFKMWRFADDTTAARSGRNLENLLLSAQQDEGLLQEWFVANRLSLNADKTVRVLFGLRRIPEENPAEVRFLGVYLDPKLTFEGHVDKMALRLSRNIYLLRNLVKILPSPVLVQSYHAIFQSIATYAIMAWGHSCHAHRIFALQRRAIRIIAGKGYREDVRPTFRDLKILTIPSRYIYECLVYAHRNQQQYILNNACHSHDTRQGGEIRIEFLRLQRTRFSFNYYAPLFYNKLPVEIKSLASPSYGSKVRNFLLRNGFYNFKEFLDLDVNIGLF